MKIKQSKFQKEYEAALINPPLCACGCGEKIILKIHHRWYGIPRYIHGHGKYGTAKYQKEYEVALLNPPLCACGCREEIIIKEYMKYRCIPKYIVGHNTRDYYIPTEEHKLNISLALKGREVWNTGLTKETDNRVKLGSKKMAESKKGQTAWNKGIPWSDDAKNKLSISHLGQVPCNKGKTLEEQFGKEKAKRIKIKIKNARLKQVLPTKDTKPERTLQEALRKFTEIETNFPVKGQPDIKIGNVLIFIDGDYWHANPEMYLSDNIMFIRGNKGFTAQQIWDKDKRITGYLANKGYTVLRFWEHDINNNLEKCINKIKENLKCQE